jgi:hypothetical protein
MKNLRFLLKDGTEADQIAEDLRVQLVVNRYQNVSVTSVPRRNEVIVQFPEQSGMIEETVESFMKDYQTGEMLE